MDHNDKDALKRMLEIAIENKITSNGRYPHRAYTPYTNKDGTESWQQKVWKLLLDPSLKEINVLAANSTGKSMFVAMLIYYILEGDHEFCKIHPGPVHVHVISKKWSTQRETIQLYLERMSKGAINGVAGMEDKDKYYIRRDADTIRTLLNKHNGNKITFASAETGSAGNVGVRPHLLIADEPVAENLYTELVVRATNKGSKFLMLATVAEPEHAWVCVRANELLADPNPYIKLLSAGMADNPFVGDDEIEYRRKLWGEDSDVYKVRVLGEVVVIAGIVFAGIEKCLVGNEYIPEEYRDCHPKKYEDSYIWAESYDFGVGNKDPFIGCFFKLYSNGEIVQEDEIVLYDKSPEDWGDAILKKREELGMQCVVSTYPQPHLEFDDKLNIPVRKPKFAFGDKAYLGRRVQSTAPLAAQFAKRKIFIAASKGEPVATTLPVCQDVIRKEIFKIKERCRYSYKFARTYQTRYNETTGKVSYDSPYDHWSDCFRYLIERVGSFNHFVRASQEEVEFINRSNLSSNIKRSVDKYRSL